LTDPALDSRRHFTQTETTYAWLRQGGVCPECQRKLDRDLFEGDHIMPWSLGGPTTLDNLQALCRACNLKKGNKESTQVSPEPVPVAISTSALRPWAVEALEVVAAATEPVLIEACPGAGKTRFALEAAARMIASDEVNRVLIVVPSRRLVEQWVDAASGKEGGASIPLAPATWRHPQPLPIGTCGGVITYQSLFAQTTWWSAFAAEPGYRVLVIFDEIHHAGTESGWGMTSQEAFAQWAARILCLTGTAFRTKDPMVFVRTREVGPLERHSVADYTYTYGKALEDGVCRPIVFEHVGGTATFQTPDGSINTVSTDDDLNSRGESYRLRTLLTAGGGHLAEMLDLGDQRLARLRATGDPDAAGLVVCIDIDHAESVADAMTERTGVRPVVVCSRLNNPDDPAPAAALEKFTDGTAPWIVAVKMVSEGVDIRRLRVLVYATNTLAELSFRQIAGRIVRVDPANDEDYGVMILPVDERLGVMADRIKAEAPVDLVSPLFETDLKPHPTAIEGGGPEGSFVPLGSTGELDYVTSTDGRRVSAELMAIAEIHVGMTGSPVPPFEIAMAAQGDPAVEAALRKRVQGYLLANQPDGTAEGFGDSEWTNS
jgi:superfamily II DNA or RNA helicase